MDIGTLAQSVTAFLAPFLPYLLKSGEKAIEEVGKGVGGDAWKGAKALWGRLFPKVESKPAALEAAQDVADKPDSKGAQNALTWQLEKLFDGDKVLAEAVKNLLEQAQAAQGRNVYVQGERNVVAGEDISGSTIITGDANEVKR